MRSILAAVLRRPSGWIPALWLGLLVFSAVAVDWVAPHDPNEGDFSALFEGPSWEHPLGTDGIGRDTLSRVIDAARPALLAGLQAVGIGLAIGVPVGLFVGYVGGWWDRIIMRIVDAIFSLPGLVLAFAVVAILGPGITNAMIAIGILFAMRFIRLTRGSVLSMREEPFIEAARISGAPTMRILRSYLLPNIAGPLIVQMSISFAAVLLVEAALSFLGIGGDLGEATWGTMLREARADQNSSPWLPWPPGLAITLTVLAFNTLGDRLRDVLALDQAERRVAPPRARAGVKLAPAPAVDSGALLQVRGLDIEVPTDQGSALAVRSLSFDVRAAEVVSLVGESGSGKTLTALGVAGLLPRRIQVVGGSSIYFDGRQLVGSSEQQLDEVRGPGIAMVFQDPMASLNPALTVGYQLSEPLRHHLGLTKMQARARAAELLDRVGVTDPRQRLADYPHQFSGGMAQRVMIAMALSTEPKLLIADEPTTALDVTTQQQVLELLVAACEEMKMAMLFITHDLGVVAELADRAVVMYAGEAVETGEVFDLYDNPRHPYTRALLGSVPQMDHDHQQLVSIPGRVPSPAEDITGCRFADRCAHVTDRCRADHPALVELGRPDHTVRCIHAEALATRGTAHG